MASRKWAPSKELLDELRAIVGAENVNENEPMAAHVTFRIGGPAAVMVSPRSVEEAMAVVRACRAAAAPLRVIGLGSDLRAPTWAIFHQWPFL